MLTFIRFESSRLAPSQVDEEGTPRPLPPKRRRLEETNSAKETTSPVKVSLTNTTRNFKGGKIKHYLSNWKRITHDKNVLDIVCGKVIPFDHKPVQSAIPNETNFSNKMKSDLDSVVQDHLNRKIIEPTVKSKNNIYCNVFPKTKSDGNIRLLANMKPLNEFIR